MARARSRRALLTASLVVLAGCGGAHDGEAASNVVASELRVARERMLSGTLHADLCAAVAALQDREGPYLDLGDWGLGHRALKAHLDWHGKPETPGLGERFDDAAHPIHAIRSYARQLREQGVELWVAPIPTRLEVRPDRLEGVTRPAAFAGFAPGTYAFLAQLAAEDIGVVDLLPALVAADDPNGADQLYLDKDYHWAPAGARVAVDVLAERLRQLEGFEDGRAVEGIDYQVIEEHVSHPLIGAWKPEPETILVRRVTNLDGTSITVKDKSSPYLLLGDSYSLQYGEYDSDLPRQLYAATGRTFDLITLSAGGRESWKALSRRQNPLTGKRVVIWLCTSRALSQLVFQDLDLGND
tara:strand:+ start:6876 stop:7943 length:1068 start_codon:yes stop_codon:yes gene_type:complete